MQVLAKGGGARQVLFFPQVTLGALPRAIETAGATLLHMDNMENICNSTHENQRRPGKKTHKLITINHTDGRKNITIDKRRHTDS